MNTELQVRLMIGLLFGITMAIMIYFHNVHETENDSNEPRYAPFISGLLLPLFTIMLFGLYFWNFNTTMAIQTLFTFVIDIFLTMSIYFAILLLLTPFLRQKISAKAIAVLWMIPNYLYLTLNSPLKKPKYIIRIPTTTMWFIVTVWFIGFVSVLVWHTYHHLKYRRVLLKEAREVNDAKVLTIWNQVVTHSRIKKANFRLVTSPATTTPLTIGLFRKSTVIVLPIKEYSEQELSLIFTHEIIHIAREDAWSKFFLVFCSAMCWFNPLMWIAKRKSSDDLELSCDESVLLNHDNGDRDIYAKLILNTASDERGFTTCLSASAKALRYRLRNIMKPRKKSSGALIVGLSFLLLFMSCGFVTVSFTGKTGEEVIYQSEEVSHYQLRSAKIFKKDTRYNIEYLCQNEEALHKYMRSLTMDVFSGNYSFIDDEVQLFLLYQTPKGLLGINLSENIIKVVPLYNRSLKANYYYVPEGIDFEYVLSLFYATPALSVEIKSEEMQSRYLYATLSKVTKKSNQEVIFESDILDTPSGLIGYDGTYAKLDFSFPCTNYQVSATFKKHSENQSIVPYLDNTFILPKEDALYTVTATYLQDSELYEAIFYFEISDINAS